MSKLDSNIGVLQQPCGLADSLIHCDPRLKIITCMLLGLCALRAEPLGLAVFGMALGCVLGLLAWRKPMNRTLIRSYIAFVIMWMAVKLGLDLWSGISWQEALQSSGLLGLRLVVLLSLGLVLAISTSSRSLGLGLTSMLRPILREKAWQLALAMALMVHFIPLNFQVIKTVHTAFNTRAPRLAWYRRVQLFVGAVLRNWSQKVWKQTLALASRGLDTPEAWSAQIPFVSKEWILGLLFAGSGAGLLLAL